jgi:hypothetical protein
LKDYLVTINGFHWNEDTRKLKYNPKT